MRGRVEICGINTAKLPVLKHEENMALLRRVKQGDEQARQELICGNLRLVLAAVKRFAGRSENVDDLFQVGCIGLMKSIDAFDLSYDVRLSSYSLPMIIGEIRRYLRDNSPIRVSRSVRDTAYRVLQAREKLLAQQQREPTVEQIAGGLGVRREEVVFAMDAALQRGQDADGGLPGDRHFTGAGEPAGKGRHRRDKKESVSRRRTVLSAFYAVDNY